jgi:hypothetical protein
VHLRRYNRGVLDPVALRRRLLLATAIVVGMGLAVEVAHIEPLLAGFSLSYEANLPTYFSAAVLLACSFAAGVIAVSRPPLRWHWWGMSTVAGWIALDEAVELHEHLGGQFGTGDVLYFDWVIPATIIVLALALLYVPFVRALAAPTRMRLVVAAAIYIGGALMMELPLGWWTESHGMDGLGYALIDWVEETMEMVGAVLAFVALVRHRQEHV